MIEAGYESSKGRVRQQNEDACLILSAEQTYMVADGVGGNNAGDFASKTAVTCVADFMRRHDIKKVRDEGELADLFHACVKEVNENILTMAGSSSRNAGMATTLVICHIAGNKAYFVNIGDSRAYIKRGHAIFQVTEDHSYINKLLETGAITRDEAKDHKGKNIITRAIGAEKDVEADLYQTDLENGDIIIICTDGLCNEVNEDIIACKADRADDMQVLSEELVTAANVAGGRDNVTVVSLKYTEGGSGEQ